jgi:hypothetical protein
MRNIWLPCTILLLFFATYASSQNLIWSETFDELNKGYWGDGTGGIVESMDGIAKYTIDVSACTLSDINDFIKTNTPGGRMHAQDIDGEAVWKSELIQITGYRNVGISVDVIETGTSTNALKYVKLFYILDNGAETPFETNGSNTGNFGTLLATQSGLNGDNLRIVIRVNNPNAGDGCIFDNVLVRYDGTKPSVESIAKITKNGMQLNFSEPVKQTDAENILNYSVPGIGNPATANLGGDGKSVDLVFSGTFVAEQTYSIQVSGISDLNQNLMDVVEKMFVFTIFEIREIYLTGPANIVVKFSHSVDSPSGQLLSNYSVDGGVGNPVSSQLLSDTIVNLTFSAQFSDGLGYSIQVNGIYSISGQQLKDTVIPFHFYRAKKFDLVINEIMADPSPPVGLPEHEYLEIFNRTVFDICLQNWKIKIGTANKTIPLINIKAGGFLIIGSVAAQNALKNFGPVIGVLGSTDLLNAGQSIALVSNLNLTVDSIAYTETWYQDAVKKEGGWSLEKIDPDNNCSISGNWIASKNMTGGTPGSVNSVDAANIDHVSPILNGIDVYSPNELRLVFNEAINPENVVPEYFKLNQAIHPLFAYTSDQSFREIALVFENHFAEAIHQIKVGGIRDFCGNVLATQDYSFTFYPAKMFDLIINELMVDVNPVPNVLPPAKYIELHNRSAFDIDIRGWQLQIGENSPVSFPKHSILAGSYLILCSAGQTANLQKYGAVLGIISESQLTVSSNSISLINQNGKLIDYLKYSGSWYGNPEKANGGWSLERVDASNFCGEAQNWKASVDFRGGTPGSLNSVNAQNPETSLPKLLKLHVLSSQKLSLLFSKNLLPEATLNLENFLVNNGVGQPVTAYFPDSSMACVILEFNSHFIDKQVYQVQIQGVMDFCGNLISPAQQDFVYYLIYPLAVYAESDKIIRIIFSEEIEVISATTASNYHINKGIGNPIRMEKHSVRRNEVFLELSKTMTSGQEYSLAIESVKDLNGNQMQPASKTFVYYEAKENDLVINEVLFNPRPYGVDYVEIYNKSGYPVDLSKISISSRNDSGRLESVKLLSVENHLLDPYRFMAITSDTSITKTDYPAASYDKFWQISAMPSYPDDKGTVVILKGDLVIDEFSYDKKMHHTLIANQDGVSLERVDPSKSGSQPGNWQSAAKSYGYGTPANKNSQFRESSDELNEAVKIEPEIISPDGDGYDDFAFIRYKFDEQGFIGHVSIYDGTGRLIKRIASNELLAAEGEFVWNGQHENGSKANIGIYVVYFEVFNLQGLVKTFKKVCVVAEKLK